MGDDTPMPVLSKKVRSLYDYFRQQFAQVTNPPIDSLRESIVMSLQTQIGPECNIFVAGAAACRTNRAVLARAFAAQIAPDRSSRGFRRAERIHRPAIRRAIGPRNGIVEGLRSRGSRGAQRQDRAAVVRSISRQGQGPRARAARHRRRASPAGQEGAALQVQYPGGDRHGPRRASFRLPDRLRRHRRVSLSCVSDAVRSHAQGCGENGSRHAPGARAAATVAAFARDCSKSCPRWASPPSPATAARSCSKSSA